MASRVALAIDGKVQDRTNCGIRRAISVTRGWRRHGRTKKDIRAVN